MKLLNSGKLKMQCDTKIDLNKKIFSFPFGYHGNQNFAWNGNLLTTLNGDPSRTITVMFFEIPPHGLGDVI